LICHCAQKIVSYIFAYQIGKLCKNTAICNIFTALLVKADTGKPVQVPLGSCISEQIHSPGAFKSVETAVVIVAGGRGHRASGADMPKQYRPLSGSPVLTRAIDCFSSHTLIDTILTVIHRDDLNRYEEAVVPVTAKLLDPVIGGGMRQDSVRAGLEGLEEFNPRNVLIHDAARPFTDTKLVERIIGSLREHDGAVPALAVTDTLKRGNDGLIESGVDRANLWGVQTPQGFSFKKLLEAHRAAQSAGKTDFTDDSSIAEWHGMNVALVEGSPANIKLTTEADFVMAENYMSNSGSVQSGESRIGQGFDVHAFTEGDHVVLCGLKIPHGKSLAGHSDADVGLHALTDALLGAIGDGDIGAHFPPSDPKWRGASSDQFLRDACKRVSKRGARIVNVDVTLICEAPKIGPHRDNLRASIAEILQVEIARVSVKATTTEGLGFAGRGEGIAAQATAMIQFA
jgi:2-C-methyl-D-erythritol 4-phosphate cytidylyltransferase/2-C-methyl-D-erythritol 2,4-cyclodiphosphate synthase